MTEKELKRKAELEKLVKESGVEEELNKVNWDSEDPLLPKRLDTSLPFEGELMEEKYWNYFLLKNEIFDEDINRQRNKAKLAIMDEIAKANLDENMQGEAYQKFIESMNKKWKELK